MAVEVSHRPLRAHDAKLIEYRTPEERQEWLLWRAGLQTNTRQHNNGLPCVVSAGTSETTIYPNSHLNKVQKYLPSARLQRLRGLPISSAVVLTSDWKSGQWMSVRNFATRGFSTYTALSKRITPHKSPASGSRYPPANSKATSRDVQESDYETYRSSHCFPLSYFRDPLARALEIAVSGPEHRCLRLGYNLNDTSNIFWHDGNAAIPRPGIEKLAPEMRSKLSDASHDNVVQDPGTALLAYSAIGPRASQLAISVSITSAS